MFHQIKRENVIQSQKDKKIQKSVSGHQCKNKNRNSINQILQLNMKYFQEMQLFQKARNTMMNSPKGFSAYQPRNLVTFKNKKPEINFVKKEKTTKQTKFFKYSNLGKPPIRQQSQKCIQKKPIRKNQSFCLPLNLPNRDFAQKQTAQAIDFFRQSKQNLRQLQKKQKQNLQGRNKRLKKSAYFHTKTAQSNFTTFDFNCQPVQMVIRNFQRIQSPIPMEFQIVKNQQIIQNEESIQYLNNPKRIKTGSQNKKLRFSSFDGNGFDKIKIIQNYQSEFFRNIQQINFDSRIKIVPKNQNQLKKQKRFQTSESSLKKQNRYTENQFPSTKQKITEQKIHSNILNFQSRKVILKKQRKISCML